MKNSKQLLFSCGKLFKSSVRNSQISTNFYDPKFQFKISPHFLILPLLLFFLLVTPDIANAGTGGSSSFQFLTDSIFGYFNGGIGIAVIALALGYSIYLLFFKHTVIPAFMVLIGGILLGNAQSIVTTLVSAII